MDYDKIIAITRAAAVVGVVVWLLLLRRNARAPIAPRKLVLVMLVVGLGCRLAFSTFTPAFSAPDEQAHYNYVKYLSEKHAFPVQTHKSGVAEDSEFYQPPAYYLLLAPVYSAAHNVLSERSIIWFLRLVSILLWLATLRLTLGLLDNLGLKDPIVVTSAAGMVCLLPTYTFISSAVNNDNLLIALGAAIFYLLSKEPSNRSSLLVGVLLGIALLTKLSAGVYLVAVVAILLCHWLVEHERLLSVAGHFLLVILPAAILFAPWAVRNVNVYGGVMAETVANAGTVYKSMPTAMRDHGYRLLYTFWAVAGPNNNVFQPALKRVGYWITCFGAAGLLYGIIWKKKRLLNRENRSFMLAAATATFANVVLAARFALLYNQSQGRFLFTTLIPISIFLGMGISLLGIIGTSRRAHIHVVGVLVAYELAFTSFSILRLC